MANNTLGEIMEETFCLFESEFIWKHWWPLPNNGGVVVPQIISPYPPPSIFMILCPFPIENIVPLLREGFKKNHEPKTLSQQGGKGSDTLLSVPTYLSDMNLKLSQIY